MRSLLAWLVPVLLLTRLSLPLLAQGESKTPSGVETFDEVWRIIAESYYDPTFHGLDWKAVRTELRPQAEAAQNPADLRPVLEEMLSRLGGSHMTVIPGDVASSLKTGGKRQAAQPETVDNNLPGGPVPQPGQTNPSATGPARNQAGASGSGDGELGFEFRILDQEAVVTRVDPTGPAERAGVKPGWVIESIEDEKVKDLLQGAATELKSHHLQFMRWGLVRGKLAGPPGTSVSIRFRNGREEPLTRSLARQPAQGEPTKLGYLPTLYARLESERLAGADGGSIGWIRFNLWMIPIVRGLDEKIDQFRQADGIIIDLRGNFGGIGGMILGFSGHFLKDRVSLGVLKMRGNELNFFANPRRVNAAGQRVEPYAGPVAILMDGLSLSAAEIFAGGMQAVGRARVFGETSGGQALPAVWDKLPNGDVLYHAFADFVTPNGVRMEGRGVVPDQAVATTRKDLLAGRDAPLLAAMEWIEKEKASPARARANPSKP